MREVKASYSEDIIDARWWDNPLNISSPVAHKGKVEAELLAIKQAVEIFANSEWVGSKEIGIVRPFKDIDRFKSLIGNVRLVFAYREVNSWEDSLAKSGIDR
ncbi:hypothetical protein PVK06_031408 [Gossypium arboreum]|uniref:Uncharacterized protein n=1 Tax=Gossypium arboreum TaxID=29729 RepID=A0ABR0NQY1_GOSAR|nr:hypothetical protein PVK06_031408 [Gossypium arboreum]